MSWKVEYVFLIFVSTFVSYCAGLGLERFSNTFLRRVILAGSITVSLSILFIFKYFNFFNDSLSSPFPHLELLLPVGVSFYTLQTISYVVEVYQRKFTAERHYGIFFSLHRFLSAVACRTD